jgi:putative two-component system response regulator
MMAQRPEGLGRSRESILIIDDSPEVLMTISGLLKSDYQIRVANRAAVGLQLVVADPPDLILLDVTMPDMDGFAACRRLKADPETRGIPVIFLTGMSDECDQEAGLALGAVDYITKPVSGPILKARVKGHMNIKLTTDFINDKNQFLVSQVSKRARELEHIQDVTILALASVAETRDNETGHHIHRTQHYVLLLAEHLQRHPRFSLSLTRSNIDLIFKSAPLHDIGKVGIPDHILLKPGKFTPEEFEQMKRHAALGMEALTRAERATGRTAPFLQMAKEIAWAHHEKWDGSGYPRGLAGEHIPISARLMALADVYDALISPRIYKCAMSHQEATRIIANGRGSHFDPDVVDAFLALGDAFRHVTQRYRDEAEQSITGESA